MMDERTRTFRPKSNNDNIQIDVRGRFRNAIAAARRHSHYVNKHGKKTDRLLSISVIEISITDMFFGPAHLSSGAARAGGPCARVDRRCRGAPAPPPPPLKERDIRVDRQPGLYILNAIPNSQINTCKRPPPSASAPPLIKLKSHLRTCSCSLRLEGYCVLSALRDRIQ